MVIYIPLSTRNGSKYKGQFEAIVDDCDAEFVLQFNWAVHVSKYTQYADRNGASGNKKIRIMMHRAILERIIGRPLDRHEDVDHVDRNGLNNVRSNLRLATRTENQANKRLQINNTSGNTGVSFHKTTGKWQAYITKNRKRIHLGLFISQEEAIKIRQEKALELFGEFFRPD